VTALLAVGIVMAGCGSARRNSAGTTEVKAAPATTLQVVSTPSSTGSEPPRTDGAIPGELQGAVDAAIADLAARLQIEPAAIVAASARLVTWPNKAAGCEQPGMAYLQVPVDGAEILLRANDSTYRYTMGGSSGPTLCIRRSR
jgi:hypothetical protein